MDPFEPPRPQTTSWWIASLAVSVLLCAGFAGYAFTIKEDLNNAKTRSDIVEQRVDMLASQVDNLRRRVMVQQAQVISPDKNDALPPALAAPLPEGQSVDTAPAPQTVPSLAAQPPKQ